MEQMTCPQCQGAMTARVLDHVTVQRCDGCSGIFLARVDLGSLIEAENDWHAHQSTNTATLPRITPDMTSAPVVPARMRSFVELLFKS